MIRSRPHLDRPASGATFAWFVASLLALGVLLLAPAAASAEEGFSVSPLRADVTVDPGGSKSVDIDIRNTTDHKLSFRLDAQDVAGSKTDPDATPVLLGGAVDSPISAASWLTPGSTSFDLAAGDDRTVTVKVAAPSGASGGHYAALTISSSVVKVSDELNAQSRVGVLFMINAGNTRPPQLDIVDVITTKPGQTQIVYTNPTNSAITPPAARVRIVDPVTGQTIAEGDTKHCGTALPGGLAKCVVDYKRRNGLLPISGAQKVYPALIVDPKAPAESVSVPIEWSGTWSSSLLPLVGLAMLIFFFLRLRRREEEEEEDDLVPYA